MFGPLVDFSTFCPDSERTVAGTETSNASYESPNTQLFGAGKTGAWHYHGGAMPTSCKNEIFWRKVRPP